MLRCPILDWINVNSVALYRAPVMHKASHPGSSPCDLDFFPPSLPWKLFQVVFSLWFGFTLRTFLLWQDSAPPRLFLFSQLPGTFWFQLWNFPYSSFLSDEKNDPPPPKKYIITDVSNSLPSDFGLTSACSRFQNLLKRVGKNYWHLGAGLHFYL